MYSCETIKLLLLGKTGTGKSATANTILGRHAFDSGSSMCSVTKKVREETKYHDTGVVIKIIDGPGLAADDVRGSIETVHSMLEHLEDDPKGYIAPLLVMRYGQRFCREDYRTVEMLQNILGKDIIKHHCIIVMTCGDLFEKDSHDITFVKWCHGQTGIFDDIFWECRQRVILFDNKTSDRRKKEDQVNRLLDLIKSSRVKGNCGNEAYMKVKATCLSPSSVASCDDEHYFDMIGQLNKQFWEIISHKPGREVTELEQLLEKVYHLENKIQETSLGENVAKRTFVENLKGSIDTQIEKLRKRGNSAAAKVPEVAF